MEETRNRNVDVVPIEREEYNINHPSTDDVSMYEYSPHGLPSEELASPPLYNSYQNMTGNSYDNTKKSSREVRARSRRTEIKRSHPTYKEDRIKERASRRTAHRKQLENDLFNPSQPRTGHVDPHIIKFQSHRRIQDPSRRTALDDIPPGQLTISQILEMKELNDAHNAQLGGIKRMKKSNKRSIKRKYMSKKRRITRRIRKRKSNAVIH
jgi:hypothetical protein